MRLGADERDGIHTFLATPLSFLGAAFFLVTPVGLAPLASALAAAFLGAALRLMVGAVSTTGTTRGLELPVADRVSRAISAVLCCVTICADE